MTYTGDVSPGGPADTREAGDLLITKVAVDPESPVNTMRESRGRSRETSLRLCSRAPRMMS